VDAQRHGGAHGRAPVRRVHPLLVQRVPRLVDGGEERRREKTGIVPHGDPHVIAVADGERVGRFVEAAPLQIVAEVGDQRAAERLLAGGVEGPCQEIRPRLRRPVQTVEDPAQFGAQRLEHGLDHRRRHPRLILVQQRVVRLVGVADVRRRLAGHSHQFLQVGGERAEVVGRPRGLPDVERQRLGPGEGLHQGRRHADGAVAVPAGLPHVGGLGVVQLRGVRQAVQQFSQPRIGEPLVDQPRQGGHLGGPVAGAADGHGDLLVPLEPAVDLVQVVELADPVQEVVVVGAGHRASGAGPRGPARMESRAIRRAASLRLIGRGGEAATVRG